MVHAVVLCIWFPWTSRVLTLVLVQTRSGRAEMQYKQEAVRETLMWFFAPCRGSTMASWTSTTSRRRPPPPMPTTRPPPLPRNIIQAAFVVCFCNFQLVQSIWNSGSIFTSIEWIAYSDTGYRDTPLTFSLTFSVPAHSDTFRTRRKCHCKQISALNDMTLFS